MANKLLSTCGAMPKKANIIATPLVAFVVVIVVALLITSPTLRLQNTHSSVAATAVTVPSKPQTVYAHVHVMRTGGSTLNYRMASHFDNVCGNKGHSLDYYQADLARKRGVDPSLTHSKPEVMDEIGYENCDWISLEIPWKGWSLRFSEWPFPVELHVPCRDPVDHFMSLCNLVSEGKFTCPRDESKLRAEMKACGNNRRFNLSMAEQFDSKCFNALEHEAYIDFMRSKLRERRWKVDYSLEYDARTREKRPRLKERECIREEANADVLERVSQILHEENHLVKFCDRCMGTKDDLLLGRT